MVYLVISGLNKGIGLFKLRVIKWEKKTDIGCIQVMHPHTTTRRNRFIRIRMLLRFMVYYQD
nr:hypothetical protein [uncultured Methanospirillum sp.]